MGGIDFEIGMLSGVKILSNRLNIIFFFLFFSSFFLFLGLADRCCINILLDFGYRHPSVHVTYDIKTFSALLVGEEKESTLDRRFLRSTSLTRG